MQKYHKKECKPFYFFFVKLNILYTKQRVPSQRVFTAISFSVNETVGFMFQNPLCYLLNRISKLVRSRQSNLRNAVLSTTEISSEVCLKFCKWSMFSLLVIFLTSFYKIILPWNIFVCNSMSHFHETQIRTNTKTITVFCFKLIFPSRSESSKATVLKSPTAAPSDVLIMGSH